MRVKVDKKGEQTKDVKITEVNADNYIVPANEKHLYHCVIEIRKFNESTGARLSKPRIQKFGKKAFDLVYPKLKEQGYTVDILYAPQK